MVAKDILYLVKMKKSLKAENGVIRKASKNRDTNCHMKDIETNISLHQGLDGGYSWVILLCVVILQITTVGTTLTSGLLVVEFREAF